jgi:energy-coupling factor transporter ATP-binding protein EcfA2
MQRLFIAGNNFSGRSAALRSELPHRTGETFFLGPYAEAALSGLSSTVADEIAIYARQHVRAQFAPIDWASFGHRKPATLSGGEQVLLALTCFSRSPYQGIGIDTALEQLDAQNRGSALDYLTSDRDPFDVVLIDNRVERAPSGWQQLDGTDAASGYAGDLAGIIAELRPRGAPVITVRGMDFQYRAGRPIFRDLNLTLDPGRAYRLLGRNGAGKTTLLKILVGVLVPARGGILLNQRRYEPRRGNRVFALATQNPDHQWCGATLAEDLARRRRALAGVSEVVLPSDARLATLAGKLGIQSPDQHLTELPLAARKRLSWLWGFSGALPWLMLDEPTIGQDRSTSAALAAIIAHLCDNGHGVIVVTHDDSFAAKIVHRELRIEEMMIRSS